MPTRVKTLFDRLASFAFWYLRAMIGKQPPVFFQHNEPRILVVFITEDIRQDVIPPAVPDTLLLMARRLHLSTTTRDAQHWHRVE